MSNQFSDVEEYEDDSEGDDEYNDSIGAHDHPSAAEIREKNEQFEKFGATVSKAMNEDGTYRTSIRATKSSYVRNLIHLDGGKFDFTGREYLKPFYDRDDKEILFKNARQTEKCLLVGTEVLLLSGNTAPIETLVPGTKIVGMTDDGHQCADVVVASEYNGEKPCLRIKTRLGSELVLTKNHPLKKLTQWVNAEDLVVGDKIASLRTQGAFGDKSEPLAAILGLIIGDGAMVDNCCRFTCKTPEVQEWYESLACTQKYNVDKRSGTRNYYILVGDKIRKYFVSEDLFNKRAHQKVLPQAVFDFDKVSTRDLLRGLWATDGHCQNVKARLELVYCSTSKVLCDQIQRLLRKFGVITIVRENWPSNGGKLAYILRVATRQSFEAFFTELGPIPGKPFTLPTCLSRSNFDTLPKEIFDVLKTARKQNGCYWQRDGFMSKGLRFNKANCPTYEKVSAYQEHLQDLELQEILDADIIWDEIISIEDAGIQKTWGIETGTNTFVADYLVNHNTTYLANHLVVTSVVSPYTKSLYVSPSHTQTRQFSSEKLRPAIERSPLIKRYFQDSFVSTQVFEKGFTNGSFIFLRSAFRTADRCLPGYVAVTTADGQQVKIADLEVGQEVLSYDGKKPTIQKVIGKECNGVKPIYKVTLTNGMSVDCTSNHRFQTDTTLKRCDELTSEDLLPVPVIKDNQLKELSHEDVKWFRVKSVTPTFRRETTFDIEVENDHIFVADGIYTHNTRGVSAKNLCLDEIQDLLLDTIPVIKECTSHFQDARIIYAGTPKSLSNPIEVYWKGTTQNEWLVPCKACNKWNFLDEKNIAPTEEYMSKRLPPGPICKYCSKPINVPSGQWVSMSAGKPMQGYRVPQLMVPWICGLFDQWLKLLWKRDNYPLSQFYNEVLGISFDSASSPITMENLVSLCGDYDMLDLDNLTSSEVNTCRGFNLVGGVDWGEGLDGSEKSPSGKLRSASYTVLTIGHYTNTNKFQVIAMKKYTGKEVDPDYVVRHIAGLCKTLGVALLGVDWGHGWGVNNTLVRLLGAKHVVQFQYLSKLKEKLKWDSTGFRYHLQRNFLISEYFFDLKNGGVEFPRWKHFEPFSKDYLAIYEERNEYRREIKYDHRHTEPDDAFHSGLYCKLAGDIFTGRHRKFGVLAEQ